MGIVGLPGRDRDLRTLHFRGEVSLITAVAIQTIGLAVFLFLLIGLVPRRAESTALRLTIRIAIALLGSAFVFAVIRGL